MEDSKNNKSASTVCLIQGIYFLITGIWPILHIQSFMEISGPKTDVWLVKTLGIVLAVIGLSLISAGSYKRINKEIFILAVGSSLVLAFMDCYYAFSDVIWDSYLLDALIEVVFIVFWVVAYGKENGFNKR